MSVDFAQVLAVWEVRRTQTPEYKARLAVQLKAEDAARKKKDRTNEP